MDSMKVVFTGSEATYTVTCKDCGRQKQLGHEQVRRLRKTVKVKCKCGVMFDLVFERRRFYRKQVNLEGELFAYQINKKLCDVTITTISVGGVSFVTQREGIRVGDTFSVSFFLDDESKALVREDIVIRSVTPAYIGAEYLDQERYNHALDFYLMPFHIVD